LLKVNAAVESARLNWQYRGERCRFHAGTKRWTCFDDGVPFEMEPLRDLIDYPRRLNSEERSAWDRLNTNYAPFVLTDMFGTTNDIVVPPVSQSSWWSLYATALMWLSADVYEPNEALQRPVLLGYDTLVTDFWTRRQSRLNRFRRFLERWRLASHFKTRQSSARPPHASSSENPGDGTEDECVLWFHAFTQFADIERYTLKWSSNKHITNPVLRAHRLVVSRGIDLICSELLANSFEHSAGAPFFVMAKLCTVASAATALAANARQATLTTTERTIYEHCVANNCPVLQLVIGDRGIGFGSNTQLRSLYDASSPGTPRESDLIRFALQPSVSSKDHSQLMAAWSSVIDPGQREEYRPVVHGLSEVEIYVNENRGHWRIHSNGTAVDINGVTGTTTDGVARNIAGCLHYIQLPLVATHVDSPVPVARLNARSQFSDVRPLDIADELYRHTDPTQASLPARVNAFCSILKQHTNANVALLINLLSLDDLPDYSDSGEQTRACALLADTFHRIRSDIGVFLIASDTTRSLLRRFKSTEEYFFDRRILAYLNLFDAANPVAIDGGKDLKPVESQILHALNPWTDLAVLRSHEADQWRLLEEMQHHNAGLFVLQGLAGGDVALEGRLKADTGEVNDRRLLIGRRAFSALGEKLRLHKGFLPWDDTQPYWFRGSPRNTHVNLGRLFADDDFIQSLVAWFSAALKSLLYNSNTNADSLVVVALLHPAVGVAQELVRTRFPKAELIEIGSLGEVSADGWQFMNLVGRPVVYVTDMVVTGATLTDLIAAVNYAGGLSIGALSILSLAEHRVPTPVFSFSECTHSELQRWSTSATERRAGGRTTERRIVDANSQFTETINGRLEPLPERATALIKAEGLSLSHRVFGRNHHIVPILIRALVDREILTRILVDLRAHIQDAFGSEPFVILYPSESTISYVIRRNDENLLPPDRCVALLPAFSRYGRRHLVPDHRDKTLLSIPRILFLDDSISSGTTEQLAQEAWQAALYQPPRGRRHNTDLKWLTYAIVRRGVFLDVRQGGSDGSDVVRPWGQHLVRHYCAVGPRPFSPGDCPLCAGLERAKTAYRLAEPLQNRASGLLKVLIDTLRPAPVEGHTRTLILDPPSAAEFLELASNPMTEAAHHLTEIRSPASSAVLLFTAFHAADLCAYLSLSSIANVVSDYASAIPEDDSTEATHLLVAMSVLPLNIARAVVDPVTTALLANGHIATASAVIALVLAQTNSLLAQFEVAGMKKEQRLERLDHLLKLLTGTVTKASLFGTPVAQAASRVLQVEINAMSSPYGSSGSLQLARTLSALFYDGAHATLLLPQLESLSADSLPFVQRQMFSAISTLESFAAMTDVFAPTILNEPRKRMADATVAGDCDRFREEARTVFKYWEQLKNRHFHSVRQVHEQAVFGLTAALNQYNKLRGTYLWFEVVPPPESIMGWLLLGPEAEHIQGHFKNLFTNTLDHASPPFHEVANIVTAIANLKGRGLLGRVTWTANEPGQELTITYQQSVPFSRKQTPDARGLLATTNAHLSMFGGSIVLPKVGDQDTLAEPFHAYRTVCVTRMPRVREVPL
jgi:hypothetical protein